MVFKRFGKAQPTDPQPRQPPQSNGELSNQWNQLGRAHCGQISQQVAALVADPDTDGRRFEWPNDPRNEAMAEAVIEQVQQLNLDGNWTEARQQFDPAHAPFIPFLNDFGQNVACVTILGPDEYLVRLDTTEDGGTLHIIGDVINQRPDILAVAASRNHEHLVIAKEDGFWISHSLDAPPTGYIDWMEGCLLHALNTLQVSDDGRIIAIVPGNESGVWIADVSPSAGTWHRAYPSTQFLLERAGNGDEDDEEDNNWTDSMMHCALSPDGRFIAYGSQCYRHFVDAILPDGTTQRWGEIGYHSEYPHNACFSNDSSYVAVNSCHFYNGATVAAKVADIEGEQTECYEESDLVTSIDSMLRVYASTWLPAGVAGSADGAFALAGLGYLNVADPTGALAFRQEFGSSASSIDYCPKTRRLVLGSYSGFLHVYDVDTEESPDRVCGYKPRKELYRWVFWRDQAPFRW
jgi:hypothetical protein